MRKPIFLLLLLASMLSSAEEQNTTLLPIIKKTEIKTTYDKVISHCNVVASAGNPEAENFNWVEPVNIVIAALGSAFNPNDKSAWDQINASMKVTLLSGPSHGTLIPDTKFLNSYGYLPNAGYSGMDQMVFEIKFYDKTYKGIYSVYVTSGSPDGQYCTEEGPYRNREGVDPNA